MSHKSQQSFCRACINACPTLVETRGGLVSKVVGDPTNALFDGYTCVKGRAQPAFHNHPERLRHSMRRTPSGGFEAISSERAMDEVAGRLTRLLDTHGPRAIAAYFGTMILANAATEPFLDAFMSSIGSPMVFSASTIDKPGKPMALAMHGEWMAPLQGYDRPDVALLIGLNPYKSYYGVACGHPNKWLAERLRDGMNLIVIDPRRSDIARRATLHLQPKPGHDPEIVACIIGTILREGLLDHAFVAENADGIPALEHAVRAFTPEIVGYRADVPAADLVKAARMFASASRGYAACGVGPGFSTGSTLIEYLVLSLETICGHWLRAGERVVRTPTLTCSSDYRAQARPPRPAYGFGERLRVHSLTQTAAGMPTGALADEILLPGDGQVRALISVGGNPVSAWPDQLKAVDAMKSLDLLVHVDPWMSSTARLAHYVIAPTMPYETPSATLLTDAVIAAPTYYGPAEAYAQYTPALVSPPPGSDVVEEWRFIYGVAQRLGLDLGLRNFGDSAGPRVALDMRRPPSGDEVLDILTRHARVPLAEVKLHPGGAAFPNPHTYVARKEPGWTGRFDLANSDILADLAGIETKIQIRVEDAGDDGPTDLPYRLICMRSQHTINSSMNDASTNRGRGYNPAFMHPDDLAHLGLHAGDQVEIWSERARIRGVVQPDESLRRGLLAMSHGFGDVPERDDEFLEIGSPTGRLLDGANFADRYVGMPRISNVPVGVKRLRQNHVDPSTSVEGQGQLARASHQ